MKREGLKFAEQNFIPAAYKDKYFTAKEGYNNPESLVPEQYKGIYEKGKDAADKAIELKK